jgi:hypothetical protein
MEQLVFDNKSVARDLQIYIEVAPNLEKKTLRESSNDSTLMELHVLRAFRSYAAKFIVLNK